MPEEETLKDDSYALTQLKNLDDIRDRQYLVPPFLRIPLQLHQVDTSVPNSRGKKLLGKAVLDTT